MTFGQKITDISNTTSYLKSFETKLYRKNSIIYSKGKKIDFFYVILNGEIESILEQNKALNSNIILKKGSSLG